VAAAEPAAGRSDSGQVERYELLRRRVLCGEPDGFRLGLAVLQRQGMAAWLKAWDGLDAVETPRVSSQRGAWRSASLRRTRPAAARSPA